MFLTFYRLLSILLFPIMRLWLWRRKKRGKEDTGRFIERRGIASAPRPEGTLIWIHAASVGESLSVLPLMSHMLQSDPALHILITTGTVSSGALMQQRMPERAIHQYVPVDYPAYVARFLAHWKPDLALWIESEFWPNLLVQAKAYCPLVLVNARISDHSFARWSRYKSMAHTLLSCFTITLPQSDIDRSRLEALGAPDIRYFGNLKYDAPMLPYDPQKLETLQKMIGNRPVWLAASTHDDEEMQCAVAHERIKETYPDLLTIIVPRHAHRGASIAQSLAGFDTALRSEQQPITTRTDIYIANTMGELGIFYRLAPIVFIGGSLIPHGGQNPLEPARLDCAILFGSHMHNFVAITEEFLSKGAAIQVQDKEALAQTVTTLLASSTQQHTLASAAKALVETKVGATEKVAEVVQALYRTSV
jgi:3-deoxy-D-manno-octulosonic-acid transferase